MSQQTHRKALPSPEELKKLPPDGGSEFNRLVFEKSPYLLQHAANPVDWYPWGNAAFEKAKQENKPVFLSIGYSTCHWCHVMEHESFEDDEAAKILNEHFVSIKVDREERPDIDQVYMTVCQALTGQGGWPLTIIMTPDKKPFFAGTYFPRTSAFNRPGLMDLLTQIARVWKEQPDKVREAGEEIAQALQRADSTPGGAKLTEDVLKTALQQYTATFDSTYGGFGQRGPKFPSPHNLSLLLRIWQRGKDPTALEMVEKTLTAMHRGGMYDQVGFGFHRYSTDREFLVPHFEKMLYDQAMLAIAGAETYQATGKPHYAEITREVFTYILRDMTSPEGGFYSAEDADSEGIEGKFYVWTKEEILQLLGTDDGGQFCSLFSVTDTGNFHDEIHGKTTGSNILYLQSPIPDTLRPKVEAWRKKLFDVRHRRIHPHKDDKILTAWNGLMIAALAKGAKAMQEPRYADAARRAAEFILSKLQTSQGRLLRSYRHGPSSILAFQEDYAAMVWGLIELYEATFETRYLGEALRLNQEMIRLFWDEQNGGFFVTGTDNESLIARMKEFYDGATPSGNSIAALNLHRLARITGQKDLADKADRTLAVHAAEIGQYPVAYSHMACAFDFGHGAVREIVIAGQPGHPDVTAMAKTIYLRFLPRTVVLFHPADATAGAIEELVPWIRAQKSTDGKATAFVCENFSCKAPTTDVKKLEELLNR